jgi:hypothetical protein
MAERGFPGASPFPGRDKLPLPATPGDKDSREMLVAHRIDDTVRAVGHGEERMSAALKAGTAELRKYHSTHIANHLSVALDNMHFLVDDLRHHYPAEAAELEAVRQCVGLARSLNKSLRIATTAHLTETVLHELAHAKRHADEMLKPDPKVVWEFNADHARKHLKGAQEHIDKLSEHVVDNYPGEGRWVRLLKQLQDGQLVTDEPAWKALKLAAPAPRGQYGLHQVPSQAVSPSPPLPPHVALPTPKECTALVKLVPDGIDVTLSNTVRQALRMAALKLEKNDVIQALACLRQAQSALYSASKKDAGAGRPAVYGAQAVPPAEQGSALAQMLKDYQDQANAWRKIGTEVARLIDRVRRHYFAGRVNGYLPNLRM